MANTVERYNLLTTLIKHKRAELEALEREQLAILAGLKEWTDAESARIACCNVLVDLPLCVSVEVLPK